MKILTKFSIGDIVYLITDEELKDRMVVSIRVIYPSAIIYQLVCGTEVTEHFEIEMESSTLKYV